jgi:hypothetical protein
VAERDRVGAWVVVGQLVVPVDEHVVVVPVVVRQGHFHLFFLSYFSSLISNTTIAVLVHIS